MLSLLWLLLDNLISSQLKILLESFIKIFNYFISLISYLSLFKSVAYFLPPGCPPLSDGESYSCMETIRIKIIIKELLLFYCFSSVHWPFRYFLLARLVKYQVVYSCFIVWIEDLEILGLLSKIRLWYCRKLIKMLISEERNNQN